ncbi:MAG: 5-amino-6-(D-ribitylamino)uracil--L-tyrosine 4-hydroxyphenyl transferase CofH [Burkholderiales bacterium]
MHADAHLRGELLRAPLDRLVAEAGRLRDQGHGRLVTWSRKVFVPLTRLCRDVCHYCTFATTPGRVAAPYLEPEQVLEIALAGERAGCHEALFTLGDKPELRYAAAREALARLGYATTIDYLAAMCELVLARTSLLPHVNPGVVTRDEIARLREVSVSQGVMLESSSDRLCEPGGVHHGSPDKRPAARLASIRAAGELRVPFTSGVLIGIGETREERVDSLFALRDLDAEHGHLQEIIVQNFRAKAGTKLAGGTEPDLDELRWTIAAARLVFGPAMNLQAPPNLTPREYPLLLDAGINDWGGVSPVTPDHVNPEAPWPRIETLRERTEAAGRELVERLPVYPRFATASARWQDPRLARRVLAAIDATGHARADGWAPGLEAPPPVRRTGALRPPSAPVAGAIARARAGEALETGAVVALFEARGGDFDAVCEAADALRRETRGDVVRYVVNRNINYTNVCAYKCRFCAFSKSAKGELRGPAYDLEPGEIARRAREAWARGATEVCMQGGIHPDYTGETYLALLRTVRDAVPAMHVHAFSPLEVTHGAATMGLPVRAFLERLRDAGLRSLPGTAAEVLDDEVRAVLCPDKLSSDEWLAVIEAAHGVGLRTTATIMFGHVDRPVHWARHLASIRALQARTGGFTEFVPLPFVHMEAPIYHQGRSRKGPTLREAVLMHAVARLALHPLIPDIHVSWVKMARAASPPARGRCQRLRGTLMNESISRSAGTQHARSRAAAAMEALIRGAGRLRAAHDALRRGRRRAPRRLFAADPITPIVWTPLAAALERSPPHLAAAADRDLRRLNSIRGFRHACATPDHRRPRRHRREGGGLALRWARAGHRVILGSRAIRRRRRASATT